MAFFSFSNSDGASSSSSPQPRHAFAAPQRKDTPHSDDQHRSLFISQAGHAFPAPQRQDTPQSEIVAAQSDSPFGRVRFTNLKKMARSRHSSNTVEDTPQIDDDIVTFAASDAPYGRVRFTKLKKLARSRHSPKTVELKNSDPKKLKNPVGSQENLEGCTQQQQDAPPHSSSSATPCRKRSRCPGSRVSGSRTFDSQNGKCCHQCRCKTMDFVVSCKSSWKGKPCTFMYCLKCLLNRYGEDAQEANQLNDWKCPRCRKFCNCSICMAKRELSPVSIHAARGEGFQSVAEMLHFRGLVKIPDVVNLGRASLTEECISAPVRREDITASDRRKDDEGLRSVESTGIGDERSGSSNEATLGIISTVSSRLDILSVLLPRSRFDRV